MQNMSDNEYEDELPSISVHSMENTSNEWTMPSAEVLASQRAREEQCERELLQLREQTGMEGTPLASARSDSSGSEGEAALSAAVRALQVQPPTITAPDTMQFLTALIQRLGAYDTRLLEEYLEVLQNNDQLLTDRITNKILSDICSTIWHEDNCWGDEQVMVVGCWLCAAACAVPNTTRPLHGLLDKCASAENVQELANVVCDVACPLVLLELSDRTLSGADGGADRFARALLKHVLRTLAPEHGTEWDCGPELSICEVSARVTGAWRDLAASERDVAVRAAGRALALATGVGDAEREAVRRLLVAISQPHTARDRNRPEHLKVRVGVAKLQLLFRDK